MADEQSGNRNADSFDVGTDDETKTEIQSLVGDSITSAFAAEQYSINTIFRILTHPGRRYVLTYLLQSDGFVTISELVDYVTTRTDTSMTDEGFRRKVTIELTHTHLPKLAEEGFVKYNMERQLVHQTEQTRAVEPYLRTALAQQRIVQQRLEDQS